MSLDSPGAPKAPPHLVRVLGHERAVSMLTDAARSGRIAQTQLLLGPPGVGKRTVARRFAQALLCTEPEPPCGACRACRLVAEGHHPDLHLVEDPLRIDAARSLRSALALAPAEGRWRVAVLPRIDRASVGAANSLLKLLEEPPAQVALVLTSASEDEVLPTIRSRSRRVSLRPASRSALAEALEASGAADADRAQLVAGLAGGRVGAALALLEDEEAMEERGAWLDALVTALGASEAQRLALAGSLAKRRDALPGGLRLWCGWLRDLLWLRLGLEDGVTNRDRIDELRRAATAIGPGAAAAALRASEDALTALAAHASPQLVLEVLLLRWPRAAVLEDSR